MASSLLNPHAPVYIPYYYSTFCAYPQPQYVYQFPRYNTTVYQLVVPSYAPALPPTVAHHCTIEELDENTGTGQKFISDGAMISNGFSANRRKVRAPMGERAVMRAPPRRLDHQRRSSVKVVHENYVINKEDDLDYGKTTLMIKNLPSKFNKQRLIGILRDHCVEENRKAYASEGDRAVVSEFDYFYLPIDFRTNSNFGFAFVNFTSPTGARRLYHYLHNHPWTSAGSSKVCEVNYARIQGLAKSIEHADRMTFNSGVPDVFLPVHFEPPFNGLNEPLEILHGRRNASV